MEQDFDTLMLLYMVCEWEIFSKFSTANTHLQFVMHFYRTAESIEGKGLKVNIFQPFSQTHPLDQHPFFECLCVIFFSFFWC